MSANPAKVGQVWRAKDNSLSDSDVWNKIIVGSVRYVPSSGYYLVDIVSMLGDHASCGDAWFLENYALIDL